MKIFINTFGSRGDVQPYIILGKAFKVKGHEVMVCTGSRFETQITEAGIEYGYITDEAFELLDADKTILEDSLGILGAVKTSMKLIKIAKPINRKMTQNAWDAAKEFEPELVIYHPKALGGVSIAEKFNVPAIMISLIPMMAPTSEFPVIGMPNLKLGGWYNKLTYKLIILGYNSYMKDLNDIRINEMGLKKLPRGTGISAMSDKMPVPILHAISPHVVPTPKDWPDFYTMNGYIFMEREEDWSPPADLQAFLDAGESPVYVGFGSMSGSNTERLTNTVVEALKQANVRGIIATGWGGLDASDLPENIFKIEKAPHDWLFERVTAVIHHGGAGTTASGLRAGRATVICPFMGDQPFWGERVEKLGVGVKTSPQKKLTTEELATAIRTATTDMAMQGKAAALGENIQAEDGIANAISTIEKIMGSHNPQAVKA